MTAIIEDNHLTQNHPEFLYKDGNWVGFGTVIIFQTGALLHFDMTQKIELQDDHSLRISESVRFQESEETWDTEFQIYFKEDNKFLIELDNITLGHLKGEGMITKSDVYWKICDEEGNTIGKTHFTKLKDGSYLINSAYKLHRMTQLSISGILSKIAAQ